MVSLGAAKGRGRSRRLRRCARLNALAGRVGGQICTRSAPRRACAVESEARFARSVAERARAPDITAQSCLQDSKAYVETQTHNRRVMWTGRCAALFSRR
jgi:hypothetical protein